MRNDQARFGFRLLAGPVAVLSWLTALVFGFQAILSGNFKHVLGTLFVCLLALLFTLVAFKGRASRWLYFIFTWGHRP
jgi:hypothetical protein